MRADFDLITPYFPLSFPHGPPIIETSDAALENSFNHLACLPEEDSAGLPALWYPSCGESGSVTVVKVGAR